jgi:GGDEF domain-containing protein
MISIRHSISDLEKSEQFRVLVLDCYISTIQNLAQYAIELDEETTTTYRSQVTSLAREVETAGLETISESRATLRALLRDYRDKAGNHVNQLREELARTANGLQRLIDAMAQTDGDHETRLRQALKTLRDLAHDPACAAIAHPLSRVGETIAHALEQFRQQQQLTVSQFVAEIHQLHKRIDALESQASQDDLTRLFNRSETEARLRLVQTGGSLLLLSAQGLRLAAVQFSRDVAHELAAAFVKRLRNNIAPEAMVGRWSEEEFLVLHPAANSEALSAAKLLTQHLSGPYACVQGGKTVRPAIQVGVAVLEFVPGDQVERTLRKINQFFKG